MRIYIPNQSKQSVGGGWTFIRNFTKYAERAGAEFIRDYHVQKGDIYLISGATMIERKFVEEAKKAGMKIVLRVDNAPKNSRNRNTGTSRLKDFADMADLIVYQSYWAKQYLAPWLGQEGKKPETIIMNGADTDIFNTQGAKQLKEGVRQYLYAQYNRDDTKRWHEAWYHFSRSFRDHPDAHLWIVGNFSPEQQEYNFDFFMDEKYRYIGVLEPADFAEYLRATDVLLIPYYNDACSNTLIEARLCGVPKIRANSTGGNIAIMKAPLEHLSADRMAKEYLEAFSAL